MKTERYRSLVRAGRSQEAQQEAEEGREDLPQCSGGVGYDNLPHMKGRLADNQLGVGAAHVES